MKWIAYRVSTLLYISSDSCNLYHFLRPRKEPSLEAFELAQPLRLTGALLLVLWLPGFALTLALFPRGDHLALPERLTLAFPLSVAATTVAALALNATPVGFRVPALAATLGAAAAGAIALGLLRRALEPAPHQPPIPPGERAGRRRQGGTALLMGVAAAAAVVVIGTVVFVVTREAQVESTELYVLSADGRAEAYPLGASGGERAAILLGVANHEGEPRAFTLELRVADQLLQRIDLGTLEDGQVWERPLPLPVVERTAEQRLDILLFRAGDSEPYRQVNLLLQAPP